MRNWPPTQAQIDEYFAKERAERRRSRTNSLLVLVGIVAAVWMICGMTVDQFVKVLVIGGAIALLFAAHFLGFGGYK